MKLNDIIAVSGLLLTLTTFLFNLAWPRISSALEYDESITGDKAKERCRKKINATNGFVVFPIFIAFFMLFYVNLPTAVKVMSTSQISLWNFDVDDTLYVMVVWALLAFVIFNFSLFIKLFIKQRKFK